MAYASKYYDPVKAHEYYMKHRKLKGRKKANSKRKSLKGLNELGKAAAAEVKEAIMEERKAEYDALKEQFKERIAALRAQLKALPPDQRAARKAEFEAKIKGIRAEHKEAKAQVKEAYEEKYLQELDKIKQDRSFRK